jgi:plasmid stabilization system protein ParE
VADIDAAFDWYETQRAGLGRQFNDALATAIERVSQHPLRYRMLTRDTRQILVRRFPYRLLYRVVGDALVIVACLHAGRDPELWRRRH